MLDQIRAACPKKLATNPNDPPQLGASHYQLAAVHEPGESNRKGAGRPSWFPAHPQPFWKIDEAPDAMPGRYMVKFWGYEGTSWYQVGELQVLDLSIGRALPVPAPPAQAQPAAPPQPADVVTSTVQASLELAGTGTAMQTGAFGELRGVVATYETQLANERARNERLEMRLEQLQGRLFTLSDSYLDKLSSLSAHYDMAPKAAQDHPALVLVKEMMGTLKEFAPALRAKWGNDQKLLTGKGADGKPLPPAPGDLAQLAPFLEQGRALLLSLVKVPDLPPDAVPIIAELCSLVQLPLDQVAAAATPAPPPPAAPTPPAAPPPTPAPQPPAAPPPAPPRAAAAPLRSDPPPPPQAETADGEVFPGEVVPAAKLPEEEIADVVARTSPRERKAMAARLSQPKHRKKVAARANKKVG